MVKINVFDTYEDAFNQLIKPHYKKNLETEIELGERYRLKKQEYINVSGYGERFRKEQEEKLPHTLKTTHPKTGEKIEFVFPYSEQDLDAHYRALPKEEHKKFLESYPDIRNGLEFMCIVKLEVEGNKYYFQQAQDALLVSPKEYLNTYNGCMSIPKLVKNVQKYLQDQHNMYRGAKVNTSFYTVNTKEPTFSAKQKEGAKESFQELKSPEHKKRCGEMLENASFWEKLGFKFVLALMFKNILKNKNLIRGLNQPEREEFEKLYSKD
jgi:hypothetical protein